jgi:5-methylcytosine-specific restriction endonuclease McrA
MRRDRLPATGERTRRCSEHERQHAWKGAGDKRSGTAAHKQRRARVLKRDRHQCQLRYEGICIGIASDLDHVVPLGEGGADSDDNCVSAGRACHLRKLSREGRRARGHNVECWPTREGSLEGAENSAPPNGAPSTDRPPPRPSDDRNAPRPGYAAHHLSEAERLICTHLPAPGEKAPPHPPLSRPALLISLVAGINAEFA